MVEQILLRYSGTYMVIKLRLIEVPLLAALDGTKLRVYERNLEDSYCRILIV